MASSWFLFYSVVVRRARMQCYSYYIHVDNSISYHGRNRQFSSILREYLVYVKRLEKVKLFEEMFASPHHFYVIDLGL